MISLKEEFKRGEFYYRIASRDSKVAIYSRHQAPNSAAYEFIVFIIQIRKEGEESFEFVPGDTERGLKLWSCKTLEQAGAKAAIVRRNLNHSFHIPNPDKN